MHGPDPSRVRGGDCRERGEEGEEGRKGGESALAAAALAAAVEEGKSGIFTKMPHGKKSPGGEAESVRTTAQGPKAM